MPELRAPRATTHARACQLPHAQAIDVEVDRGPGQPCKLVHVAIDVSAAQQPGAKPYLGGFKHKQSGATFHHASCQTMPPPPAAAAGGAMAAAAAAGAREHGKPVVAKQTHEAQTVDAASTSSQTAREAATQMARPSLQLDCAADR